jgi:hypothetical protein
MLPVNVTKWKENAWWACIKKSLSGETFDFEFQWSLTGPGGPWAIAYLVVLEDSRDGCGKTVVGLVGWDGMKG